MFEVGFFTVLSLYVLLSTKVDEWITISALGFSIEIPPMFMQKARYFEAARAILFVGAGVLAFTMSIPWFAGIGLLSATWLVAGYVGRKKAYKKYRDVLAEMIEHAETDSEKLRYQEAAKKTDRELEEMVMVRIKRGY